MIRPMRLGNRAMEEEKARKLLAECEYALFTTVDEEGAPHTVPVSPVVLGNALYFHCAPAGEKLDNIQKNPQVCLCALGRTQVLQKEMTMAYESVVAQGKARLAQGEEARRALLAICQKYSPGYESEWEKEIEKFPKVQVVAVDLIHITGKQNRL